jgi:hypothetical protein
MQAMARRIADEGSLPRQQDREMPWWSRWYWRAVWFSAALIAPFYALLLAVNAVTEALYPPEPEDWTGVVIITVSVPVGAVLSSVAAYFALKTSRPRGRR